MISRTQLIPTYYACSVGGHFIIYSESEMWQLQVFCCTHEIHSLCCDKGITELFEHYSDAHLFTYSWFMTVQCAAGNLGWSNVCKFNFVCFIIFVNWQNLSAWLLSVNDTFVIRSLCCGNWTLLLVVIELFFLALSDCSQFWLQPKQCFSQAKPACICCSIYSDILIRFRNVKALTSIIYKHYWFKCCIFEIAMSLSVLKLVFCFVWRLPRKKLTCLFN